LFSDPHKTQKYTVGRTWSSGVKPDGALGG